MQKYLINIEVDKNTAYKTILAIDGIYTSRDGNYSADIGVKLKDDKIRFMIHDYSDNEKEYIPIIMDVLTDKDIFYNKFVLLNFHCVKLQTTVRKHKFTVAY